MGKRKTAEEKAEDERRYALARAAHSDADFEPFFTDANQAIRNAAALNPDASAAVLARFASDRFWSTRIAVAEHPNSTRETVLSLLESNSKRRGVVHHAARRRLESEGVVFGNDGMPSSQSTNHDADTFEGAFARSNVWLPRVLGENGSLRLEFSGGADALHGPRTFSTAMEARHLHVIRADLPRHLILWSVLLTLCEEAGINGAIDEAEATALLDAVLFTEADQLDAFLSTVRWNRAGLIAHGADQALLDAGQVLASLGSATEAADWGLTRG